MNMDLLLTSILVTRKFFVGCEWRIQCYEACVLLLGVSDAVFASLTHTYIYLWGTIGAVPDF